MTAPRDTRTAVVHLRVATRGGPRPVPVTWSVPTHRSTRGTVLLHHGFTRHPRHLDGLAAALAEAGLACVRPHLGSLRRSSVDATFVTALTLALAAMLEDPAELPQRLPSHEGAGSGTALVIAGHSVGAARAVHGAAVLAARGGPVRPAGLVLLDGVDSPTRLIAAALPALGGIPLLQVSGPPTRCNRHGALARVIAGGRSGYLGVTVVAGGHGDAEGEPHRRPAPIYRLVCRDGTAPEDRALVRRLAVSWCRGLAAGDREPTPGPTSEAMRRWVRDGRVAPLHGLA